MDKCIRAHDITETINRWHRYQLPEKFLDSPSFLDVGCWSGGFLYQALYRGAKRVVGVDVVRSPGIDEYLQADTRVEFYQMDVFSPHFLSLPRFDWVFCAGLFYHVPDPVELLKRLKTVTGSFLVLESAYTKYDKAPMMYFCRDDTLDSNYSNWWLPNLKCLVTLLEEVGFEVDNLIELDNHRVCIHASLSGVISKKILPRKLEYMKS